MTELCTVPLCGWSEMFKYMHIYTVNHKKRDVLFLTITLANLNQLL